jgi:Glycosyl transferase family 2
MKSFKVSIILPVYNVEKYLSACLDSLLAQTLEEIEIVAVNDGSTDGSLQILQAYQSLNPEKLLYFPQRTTASAGHEITVLPIPMENMSGL